MSVIDLLNAVETIVVDEASVCQRDTSHIAMNPHRGGETKSGHLLHPASEMGE
jgi:hypothetical protein